VDFVDLPSISGHGVQIRSRVCEADDVWLVEDTNAAFVFSGVNKAVFESLESLVGDILGAYAGDITDD
jgi:hypothetical protein